MADVIRVNTELLERCANILNQAAQGFGDAASILASLNTGEEWWEKVGGFNPIRLQDEGTSAAMGTARGTVHSLTNVMHRYDSRMSKLGKGVSSAAALFSATESALSARANRQGAGTGRSVTSGAAGGLAGIGANVVTGKASAVTSAVNDDAARKKREKKAKIIKYVALGACIVGGIALTVATAGAASPLLVGAISGGVTGAVMGGVNRGTSLYTEGGWSNVKANGWDIGKEALIGGITGAVTGVVTGAVTSGTQGLSGIGGKALAGGVTKLASGMTSRATDTALHGLFNRDSAGKVLSNTLNETFNGKALVKDFLTGGVKGGVGEITKNSVGGLDDKLGKTKIGKAVTDSIGKCKGAPYIKEGATGALKEMAGGAASRFTGKIVDGKGFSAAWKSIWSPEDAVIDGISGGGVNIGKQAINGNQVNVDVAKKAAANTKDFGSIK